jgi:hypothetical protein
VIVRRLLGRIRWTRLEATAKWPASVDRRCDVEESPFSSFTLYNNNNNNNMDWERLVVTYAVAESVLLLNFMSITKHKQQRTITELSSIITLRVCMTKGRQVLRLNGAGR